MSMAKRHTWKNSSTVNGVTPSLVEKLGGGTYKLSEYWKNAVPYQPGDMMYALARSASI
jgi:hypothetical protein